VTKIKKPAAKTHQYLCRNVFSGSGSGTLPVPGSTTIGLLNVGNTVERFVSVEMTTTSGVAGVFNCVGKLVWSDTCQTVVSPLIELVCNLICFLLGDEGERSFYSPMSVPALPRAVLPRLAKLDLQHSTRHHAIALYSYPTAPVALSLTIRTLAGLQSRTDIAQRRLCRWRDLL
jgi:hypothetical protein